MSALREAEDLARTGPVWQDMPTADRIRSIYEQITEDVLEGRVDQPPLLERLRRSESMVLTLCCMLSDCGVSDEELTRLGDGLLGGEEQT